MVQNLIKSMGGLFFIFLSLTGFPQDHARLTVKLNGLDPKEGQVSIMVYDAHEKELRTFSQPVLKADTQSITLLSVPKGRLGLKLYHDQNQNGEFDKNFLGIPSEGYGFSNNPKARMGPPSLEETLFNLRGDTLIQVEMIYLSFF